ncbi:MAG: 3-ketoacyl-ACP reductase [Clostridia bacterium]|nr:3-ketoacyl-ACP reductase [Clostridia bacterium]
MAHGKTALVTGASRGIGRGIAERLAQDGFDIATIGSGPESAAEACFDAVRAAGGDTLYVRGSIADADDRARLFSEVIGRFGRLDLLVNNAGIAPRRRGDLLEVTSESLDEVLGVNLKGTFFMCQAAAAAMLAGLGSVPDYRPAIVNISSVSAYASSTSRGEYCISKAGIAMVTKLFADRLAADGIPVYEIRPGIIRTDMTAAVRDKYDRMIAEGLTPIPRWGTPEDIAAAVSVLAAGSLTFCTGQVLDIDGGFHIRRL